MRGKLSLDLSPSALFGITPAYAGKTLYSIARLSRVQDHPRVCGENRSLKTSLFKNIGSPPRMRGKLGEWEQRKPIYRITPAYAGKTVSQGFLYSHCPDHPRVCGENPLCLFCKTAALGSPPRMRGKLNPNVRSKIPVRITPAYAGKTFTRYALNSQR